MNAGGKIYSGKSAVAGSAVGGSGMSAAGPKKFGSSANVNNHQVSELEG